MTKFKPRAGQVLAVLGEKFISKAIILGESIIHDKKDIDISHIAGIVEYKSKLCVNEMIGKNMMTSWEESEYAKNEVKYLVLEPIMWWTDEQINVLNQKAAYYFEHGVKYAWCNMKSFLWRNIRIALRFKNTKWTGETSDKKMVCSELWARLINFMFTKLGWKIPFPNPDLIDPNGLFGSGYLIVKYKNF